jgi:murein L,D-transpeptidase YcbB/YkuD
MLRSSKLLPTLLSWRCALALAGALACAPAAAQVSGPAAALPAPISVSATHPASPLLQARLQAGGRAEVYGFYAGRDYKPIWLGTDGSVQPAALALVQLVETAELDGIAAGTLKVAQLTAAVRAAGAAPTPDAQAEAELLLSIALVDYAQVLLSRPDPRMAYEHEVMRPYLLSGYTILDQAATAPSLQDYVTGMEWMHPLYASLRTALATGAPGPAEREALIGNLERVRGIPRPRTPRHVIVDAASARLWMYEGDRVVDSMKVVVGTAATPTPIMAGFIRTAVFNPYWYVPTELLRRTVAARARSMGAAYLRRGGYQVISSWEPDAEVISPVGIDWRAVESGETDVIVRQLPSATNAMGKMKFEFPNLQGIYLHDTPDKALMLKDVRQLSNGCIRLEDAVRFGNWLMGGSLPSVPHAPEQRLDLTEPVPIYITYLTMHAEDGQMALGPDPYGHYAIQAQGPTVARRAE